jgi:diaminobutyrate-2-oxoglutarate transaminase
VTAKVALEHYWSDNQLEESTKVKGEQIRRSFTVLSDRFEGVSTRGRGLVQGLVFADSSEAGKVSKIAFERGLLVETSGADDEVVKLLPPLTITSDELDHGLGILDHAVATARGGN